MEVKETTIADLPIKVLVMIFQRLPFADRLRASTVCRHWNWIVFEHFGDGILLHLEDGNFRLDVERGSLCGYRDYRNVRVIGESILDLQLVHGKRFEVLGERVRDLEVVVEGLDVGRLEKLLGKFVNLETLTLFVLRFKFELFEPVLRAGKLPGVKIANGAGLFPSVRKLNLNMVGAKSKTGLNAFMKVFRQRNLPSVRHIFMTCFGKDCGIRRNPSWLTWLNEFAPVLQTLSIDFVDESLLAKFCAMNFTNLESLTIRLIFFKAVLFPEPIPCFPDFYELQLEHFEQFLTRLTSLTTLRISLNDIHYGEVVDSIYSLDHLEHLTVDMVCNPICANPLLLRDIWYMKNLRKLELFCDHIEYPPRDTVEPMSSVVELTLKKVKRINFGVLKAIFPCIKVLDVRECPPVALSKLVAAWPSLENLSISITDLSSLTKLGQLKNLRVLRIFSKKALLNQLEPVLQRIDTLEQLHLEGEWSGQLPSDFKRACRVYLPVPLRKRVDLMAC